MLVVGASIASAQNANGISDETKNLLDAARQLNGLAVPGIQPWVIKVTFQRYDQSGNFVDRGTYKLLWHGPAKTNTIYASPSFSQVQYTSHDGVFVTGDHGDPPGLLAVVWWIAHSPLPDGQTARLGASLRKKFVSGFAIDCVELGKGHSITRYDRETDTLVDTTSDASTPPDSYCFDERHILAQSSRTVNGFGEKVHATFRNPVEFDHRMIARDLDLDLGGILNITAHVDSIEPLQDLTEDELQVPPDARELGNEGIRYSDFPKSIAPPELVNVSAQIAANRLSRRTSAVYPEAKAAVPVLNQIDGRLQSVYPVVGADADLKHFQVSVQQMASIAENKAKVPGRKLLIWIGPGWPMVVGNNFQFSDRNRRRYFDAIVELSTKLREARMAVYSVSASGPSLGLRRFLYQMYLKGVKSPQDADTGSLAFKVLATQSGGRIFGPDNDVVTQVNHCIADANAFYTLSFNPPPASHADEYHDLKIVLGKPGLLTQTNTGYYDDQAGQKD